MKEKKYAPSLTKTSKELKEERAVKDGEMTALLEGCVNEKKEKRDLNDEETTKYEKLLEEIRDLDGIIEATEELEQEKQRQAARKIAESQKEKEVKEVRSYSFLKAVRQWASKGQLDGIESEMDKEARIQGKNEGISYRDNALAVPFMVLSGKREKRDMTAGTVGEGGYAVATELKDFIEYLWDRSVLRKVGADFMSGLVGNIAFPKELTVPTATWEGETDAGAESSPTLTQVTMSPKRVGTYVDLSNLLLIQTSPSIEARIRRRLMTAMNNGIEYAALHGDGTGGSPTGVAATADIGSVAIGTNGGFATLNHMIELETEVAQDNADVNGMAYVTNAKVRGRLKQTKVDEGSGLFVWPVNATEINGYPVGISNLVSSSLTKGTASGICSAILFGNWGDLAIGQWGGMEILPDPYSLSTQAMLRLVVNIFADVAVMHAESFAAILDAKTS